MEKLDPKTDGASKRIVDDNIEKMKLIFPEAFTEGKVDFEALKEVLGTFVDGRDERYSFTWNGKSKARMIAQTPSTGTLRPCKEESVDWETTQNIFIEGDNLEVLKLLQKSYHKKVKMIYIDPPYNTGKDFVYKDNFKDNIKNYKEITGQLDGEGRNLSNNPETSGRYHTDWLNMMYPRLKLARNLLKDDGVIFISIDDNEVANLRKICDEIFGEENFLATISRKTKLTSNKGSQFSPSHEYILVFAKSIINVGIFNDRQAQNSEQYLKLFSKEDNRGRFNEVSLYMPALKGDRPSRYYIECPDGSKVIPPGNKFWRWAEGTFLQKLSDERVVFKETKTSPLLDENGKKARWNIYTKLYLHERLESGLRPSSDIVKWPNSLASKQMIKIGIPFPYAKPAELIAYLAEIINCEEDDIVLDFFAGSATTAHAVMQLNSEDNGNRKFIMVQLPEACDEKTEAFKAGYKTIAEISKERIRRAAAKVKEENPEYDGDLGFKIFKLDSTNIKPWEVDFDLEAKDLLDYVDNVKEGRTEEDILYEVLLKYGLDLALPITEHDIAEQKVFDIGMGALIICLSDAITLEVVEGIAKLKDELKPEIMRVVFKDSGFKDDEVKTNAVQILKQANINDMKSL